MALPTLLFFCSELAQTFEAFRNNYVCKFGECDIRNPLFRAIYRVCMHILCNMCIQNSILLYFYSFLVSCAGEDALIFFLNVTSPLIPLPQILHNLHIPTVNCCVPMQIVRWRRMMTSSWWERWLIRSAPTPGRWRPSFVTRITRRTTPRGCRKGILNIIELLKMRCHKCLTNCCGQRFHSIHWFELHVRLFPLGCVISA